MVKTFSILEHNIIRLLLTQNSFIYNNRKYEVSFVGKPVVAAGEPKTDIFLLAESVDAEEKPLVRKISFKQPNYDFVENKISAARAEEIFGSGWSNILINCFSELAPKFYDRKLIFKNNYQHTQAGSFTLGWKVELVNKGGNGLNLKMPFSKTQVENVYSGGNLEKNKRDATVNGQIIKNSGVADYILVGENYNSIEEMLNGLVDIKTYVKDNPDLYLVCKALNYRSFEEKYDGNRPLGVYVKWSVKNDKLMGEPILDHPLEKRGDEIYDSLMACMKKLHIKTTNDVNSENADDSIIFEQPAPDLL